jgi:broad specificity phosphatase PhoE
VSGALAGGAGSIAPGTVTGPPDAVPEDLSRTTTVVLVRHALPLTGVSADPPLSGPGLVQARRAGDWLRWESPAEVVSSPYRRAADTAAAIGAAAGVPVTLDEDLREWSAPAPPRYITPELLGETVRGRAFAEGRFGDFVPEHDRDELTRRMTAAVGRAARRWPGRTVVLVSHGGAINNLLAGVVKARETFFFDPGYTALSRLRVMSSGRMVLASVNETAHLLATRTDAVPRVRDESVA